MKKFLFVAIASTFVFVSCKKDDEGCAVNSSTIAGTYKVTAARYKASASTPEVDGLPFLFSDDCEKDNTITFAAGNVFTFNDAGVACSPSGSFSGTWSTSGNSIIVSGDTTAIQSFDCTNMVIVEENFQIDGDKMTITYSK